MKFSLRHELIPLLLPLFTLLLSFIFFYSTLLLPGFLVPGLPRYRDMALVPAVGRPP